MQFKPCLLFHCGPANNARIWSWLNTQQQCLEHVAATVLYAEKRGEMSTYSKNTNLTQCTDVLSSQKLHNEEMVEAEHFLLLFFSWIILSSHQQPQLQGIRANCLQHLRLKVKDSICHDQQHWKADFFQLKQMENGSVSSSQPEFDNFHKCNVSSQNMAVIHHRMEHVQRAFEE